MTYRVEITIPGAGEKWNIEPVLEVTRWKMENTVGKYKSWWKGTFHKDRMNSDTMVIEFEDEQDAVAFRLKYECDV